MAKRVLTLVVAIIVLGAASVPKEVGGGVPSAELTVVHAIDGRELGRPGPAPIDVRLDGARCITAHQRFGAHDSVTVTPGRHRLEALWADGSCGGERAIAAAEVDVRTGDDLSIAVHLDEGVQPRMSVYRNPSAPPGHYRARVAVRHAGAIGPIDLDVARLDRADLGFVSFAVPNSFEAVGEVWVGEYEVLVARAATNGFAVAVERLWARSGRLIEVYVVGGPVTGTGALVVER